MRQLFQIIAETINTLFFVVNFLNWICTGRLVTVDSEVDGADAGALFFRHAELSRAQLTQLSTGTLVAHGRQQIAEVRTGLRSCSGRTSLAVESRHTDDTHRLSRRTLQLMHFYLSCSRRDMLPTKISAYYKTPCDTFMP